MSDNSNNPELNQLVSFIQHDLPGLNSGQYQLQVSQEIRKKDKVVSDDPLQTDYRFSVTGDRFRIVKPDELIYSTFPAGGDTGLYNTVFPSVVFTKTSFPWSRYPTNTLNEAYTPPAPGEDVDGDVSTWLTIITLDEDDIKAYADGFKDFKLETATATMGDLFSKKVNDKSTLGDNYSYFFKVDEKDHKPLQDYMDPGDKIDDGIDVMDIPLPLFWKIAPTLADLKVMAHIRKVSLINKPTMAGISDVGEPEGSFSIVFGNRLPNPGKKNFAYLVSLEQMQDFLPTNEEGGEPVNKDGFKPDKTKVLRLAVLKSWTFYSVGESATFVNTLNKLNNAAPPINDKVNEDLKANTNLRLVAADKALPIVKNALQMGYIPLNHDLRIAEQDGNVIKRDKTVSWYRGPMVPYTIDKPAVTLPVSSPDQATIFDPTTGMFDVSYSTAWTLGRQMALQDTGFSTALYNWKKGLTQEVINKAETQLLEQSLNSLFVSVNAQAAKLQRAGRAAVAKGDEEVMLRMDGEEQLPDDVQLPGNLLLKTILSLAAGSQASKK